MTAPYSLANVLVDGVWRPSDATESFEANDPATGAALGDYPMSSAAEVDAVVAAAVSAARTLRATSPEQIAQMLELLAAAIEAAADELVATAASETGLAAGPRLHDVELPRTAGQLRQAADAARSRSWRRPQLTSQARIAAWHAPIPGPVVVFGPNNFPLAFNPTAGGDFAAAIATHHPVIAKSNPGHPGTTALRAELARQAAVTAGLPAATVQLLHGTDDETGRALVADRRIAATAYTGSRRAGLALKAAATGAGVLIFAEMAALNPVVVLPGAAVSRAEEIASALAQSVTGSGGQMCTKPGMILVDAGSSGALIDALAAGIAAAPVAVLLGAGVAQNLRRTTDAWLSDGAVPRTAPRAIGGAGHRAAPMLYQVHAEAFLERPDIFGQEAFGPTTLVVVAADLEQILAVIAATEPSLTGSVYSSVSDHDMYVRVRDELLPQVGRFLDDKVPTGVAVVPTMHHGGPFPSTGHPAFTSVGIPASLLRFTARQAFDNVRDDHLPPELQADNPLGLVREVDRVPTTDAIVWGAA
ncbi:aldehyde dehydrogenase (NADP(+)) [soil metagenome]